MVSIHTLQEDDMVMDFRPMLRDPHPKGLDVLVARIPESDLHQLHANFNGIRGGHFGPMTEEEQHSAYRAAILNALSAAVEGLGDE
jgi:hypothetical protein